MQVQELKNEGLSREFSVTISVSDIDARIDARLGEIGGDVRIPGFRPGKAPIKVLRQRYGKAVMLAGISRLTYAAVRKKVRRMRQ